MQGSIAVGVLASLSDNGFSLDELIVATKEMWEREGLSGFVAFVLNLLDERLAMELVAQRCSWSPRPCCQRPHYEHHDRQPRQFRTSVGEVKVQWRRLRCRQCGKSLTPLRQFLGLEPYQSKTSELEKLVTEVVSEQSYRRSSDHLSRIGEIPVPFTTLHRWVVSSDCDQLEPSNEPLELLVADATAYKRRPKDGQGNRGSLQVAVGVRLDGKVQPLGAWSQQDWDHVAKDLRQRHGQRGPLAKVLVSDGDPHLIDALSGLTRDQQRCHWHLTHDLYYVMHDDKAPLKQKKAARARLAGLLRVELPTDDFQKVSPQDKATLQEKWRVAQQKVHDFATELFAKGYYRAGHYIRRAEQKLFTYVRWWLQVGLVSPRVSSMLERMIREIARRLKRIAFGWSPSGAAQMTRILIKRITSADQWEAWWKKRLRIDGKVIFLYRGTRLEPQPLGR